MKKEMLIKTFAIFILAIGIGTITGFAQNNSEMTFQISTAKTNYIQLEPINLKLNLSNQTNQSIKWQAIFGGRDVDLLVQKEGSEERTIKGNQRSIVTVISPKVVFEQGRVVDSRIVIADVNQFEHMFPSAGTYSIRAKFNFKRFVEDETFQQSVLSNQLTVNIIAPTGMDRTAYDYLKNTLEPARKQGKSARNIRNLRADFVDLFAGSVYTKRQILLLAYNYLYSVQDVKAMKEFCKLSSDEDSSYLPMVRVSISDIDSKLRPPDLRPLPPEAQPLPARVEPCVWIQSQTNR